MSTDADIVLVTGATGNVGREVVRALRARNIAVRAADRDPARARALFGDDLDAVRFDYRDAATFAAADGARSSYSVPLRSPTSRRRSCLSSTKRGDAVFDISSSSPSPTRTGSFRTTPSSVT